MEVPGSACPPFPPQPSARPHSGHQNVIVQPPPDIAECEKSFGVTWSLLRAALCSPCVTVLAWDPDTHQPSHRTKKVLDFDLFLCSYWITQERFSPKQEGQEEEAAGFGGMRSRSSSSGTSSRWYPSCSSCWLRSWVTCCGGQSGALRDGHTSTLCGVMLPAPSQSLQGSGEPGSLWGPYSVKAPHLPQRRSILRNTWILAPRH